MTASGAGGDRRLIAVFAKEPQPGAVKTRLCPPLEPAEAARLYGAMLDDVLASTVLAAAQAGAAAWLLVHPPGGVAALAARAPAGFHVAAQRGADLAARMAQAAADAALAGYARVLLRGSDNPSLAASQLVRGLAALDDADLAVGPDRDGGYGWIALRCPAPPDLFAHPMSTPSVLADTLARAAASGLRVRPLEPHFDVDRIEDLALLADARRRGAADDCPRTLALLDREDLWRRVPGLDEPSGTR